MWPVAAGVDSPGLSASNFTVSEVFKLVSKNQRFFFQERRGDPVSGTLASHLLFQPTQLPTLCSGLCPGRLIKIFFEKRVLLLKKKKKNLKPSGLFQNPELEVIHLECLELEAYTRFQ